MPSTRHGARRALLLLGMLDEHPRSYQAIEDELREELEPDTTLEGDRSVERIRRRAVEDLVAWGVPVADTGRALYLDRETSNAGSRTRLALSAAQARLRGGVAASLRELDPGHEVDPMSIDKVHIPCDRLAFTYGTPPVPFEGIPYRFDHGERPALYVRTPSGDLRLWSDAIRTMRLVETNAGRVTDGDPGAPVIEASPVDRSWERRRGRPHDVATLRRAQRLLAAVRTLAAPPSTTQDIERTVSFRDVARCTSETLASVRSLSELVGSIDADISDEADHFVVRRSSHQVDLDGAGALVARLELAAVLALGDGAVELDPSFTHATLQAWRDTLDAFLSAAAIEDVVAPAPCAKNLVAAALGRYPSQAVVVLDRSRCSGLLEVDGLRWRRLRWWVNGRFDGRALDETELSMVDVLELGEP